MVTTVSRTEIQLRSSCGLVRYGPQMRIEAWSCEAAYGGLSVCIYRLGVQLIRGVVT